jgi:hypothetical protein
MMPTKVILLKFDINRVMKQQQQQQQQLLLNGDDDIHKQAQNSNEVTTTTTTLTRVTLNMYALTESKFGGYVTRLLRTNSPAGGGAGRRTDDNGDNNDENSSSSNNNNNNWDEESTTWSEYVNGDNERDYTNAAKKLLPDDDTPRGEWILI